MKRTLIFLLSLLLGCMATAQEISLDRDFGKLYGTLLTPEKPTQTAALIIAGSGPTDRNGNGYGVKSNSYRYLAETLQKAGIATLRYDKRAIGASRYTDPAGMKEENLSFDLYIDDAAAWVDFLAKAGYKRIILIGHSEGSLIALSAAQNNPKISAVICVAGAAYPLGDILKLQLSQQLAFADPALMIQANGIIDRLQKGERVENPPESLNALFRPSVQPFLISEFRLDPRTLIARLSIPVLIIQGDNDIQVATDNAEALAKAQPKARKIIIPAMTHTLKKCDSQDRAVQISTVYANGDLPLDPDFARSVTDFITLLP